MIEDFTTYVGDGQTPFDLYTARRDVLDYHLLYGMPAIVKRAYNLDHIGVGLGPQGETVTRDRTYDDAYGQGFFSETAALKDGIDTSGYGDGWLTYLTLDDAEVDPSKAGIRGAHKTFTTNGMMPWNPRLQEQDLIILVEIQRTGGGITILGTDDRFVVQTVTAVTIRGHTLMVPIQEREGAFAQDVNRSISQRFQAVRMPRYNGVYDIPIEG